MAFSGILTLAHYLSVHLLFHIVIPLYDQHYMVAYNKVGILMLVGVIAHAHGIIRQVAEHASAIFAGDHCQPLRIYGMIRPCICAF